MQTDDGEVVLGWTVDHPLLSELGSEIQVVADRLKALPLPALGTDVLTSTFTPEYQVTNAETWSLIEITEHFMPPHREPKLNEPDEATGAECEVHELVAEAVQLLEHAGLLMHRNHHYTHNHFRDYTAGYATTRLESGDGGADGQSSVSVSISNPQRQTGRVARGRCPATRRRVAGACDRVARVKWLRSAKRGLSTGVR
ncbi:MAG: hypothetical protein ACLP01_00365 [Solirubrobacteraceae bacterium]